MSRYLSNGAPQPLGFCQCGCGNRTFPARQSETKRGYIKGQPQRFLPYHNRGKGPGRDYYSIDPASGCWLWQRGLNEDGYGILHKAKAHTYYYRMAKGEVPNGHVIDHLCGVRHCVNPDHLQAVLHVENVRRGRNAKLTMEKAREIRERHGTGDGSYRSLAREFGITPPQVYKIVKGLSWAE